MFRAIIILLACFFIAFSSKAGVEDSLKLKPNKNDKVPIDTSKSVVVKPPKSPRNPTVAGVLSAVVPGAGQLYNGRWWKVPIIYGAGYAFYRGIEQRSIAQDFYHGLLVLKDNDATDAEIISYVDGFEGKDRVTNLSSASFVNSSESEMKVYYDDYSSKLQNLYIFSVVFYSLNILDAVVDAHLRSFDVRDDLSLKIKPGLINSSGTIGGLYPSIGLQFTLK